MELVVTEHEPLPQGPPEDTDTTTDTIAPTTPSPTIVYVGSEDYKDKSSIIYFEIGDKGFPTKPVKNFMMLRVAKAEYDHTKATEASSYPDPSDDPRVAEMGTKVMAYTYELMMAMIPKRYHEQFATHLMETDYQESDIDAEIERVMTIWANGGKNAQATVSPLPQQSVPSGPDTQQSEKPTLRVVSLHKRTVEERELTEEEQRVHANLMSKRAVST